MKKFTKLMAMLLVLTMMLSLVACAGNEKPVDTTAPATAEAPTTEATEPVVYADPYAGMEYDEQSEAIYNDVLGEFLAYYDEARDPSLTVSESWAKMAIAEAKLMESAVYLPLTSNGGNYAISRVVTRTASTVLYGGDSDRFYTCLISEDLIKKEDSDALKALWTEKRGTGEWLETAKQYMTDHGYTLKDSYSRGYSSDPQTWDALNTSRAADAEAIVNTYCGLVEYDAENVMQPALAESWEVSPDGLTYTFKIRQGVDWVDSQGRKVDTVTADSFVAGMQHMMDCQAGLEFLIDGKIVNASEYISGEVTDFAEVGVKAVDEYTLQYTLVEPCNYFMTMLSYGLFAPMSRTYYESKGGKFGADFDASAESYTYGKTPNDIAYCGAYLVSNATAENTIVFKANPAFWNADAVNVKTLTWLYNDGQDALKAYNDTVSGVLDGAGLNASAAEKCKADGLFEDYAYTSATDASAFGAFYSVNRVATENVNDGAAKTSMTEEQLLLANAAMRNVHFRRALAMATDRATYNAQTVGDELKYNSMINSYTPGTFVALEEDTTVDINGTATTFPAGTYYGQVMQAQIDADGLPIKVWSDDADNGAGGSFGYDGWYNPEAAVAELDAAIEELAAIGVEVSVENPIYLDLPYFSGSEAYGNRANAYKQNIESVLGGKVIINLLDCVDSKTWYYAGYYTDFGNEANYNIYDVSGWSPDYGDPSTYLDTFLPDYAGYMVKCIGIF